MGHTSPSIAPRSASRKRPAPARYNGTHIGASRGPTLIEEEVDSMDTSDLFGAIILAEIITDSFLDDTLAPDCDF